MLFKLLAIIGRHWPFPHGTGWLVERPARLIQNWPNNKKFSLKDGRIFEGDLNDPLFRSLYLYGEYEPASSAALRSLIRPGDTVIDVGANVGILTCLMGRLVGQSGHVYSFEPVPPTFEKLKTTIFLNHLEEVVSPVNQAVCEAGNETAVIYHPDDHSHACSSFRVDEPRTAALYTCPTIALDQAKFIGCMPALVKVDVEGAEMSVLRGAAEWCMDRQPPIWMIEINRRTAARFGYAPEDLVEWLSLMGYRRFYWSDDHDLKSFSSGQRFPADGMLFALPEWAHNEGRSPKAV